MEENYRRYPIGIQNFEQLRNRNCVYVDKTELVYRLANTDSVYFLSRPRRFGKSLLVSTLEAYFQGKKDLFKGRAMERLEKRQTTKRSRDIPGRFFCAPKTGEAPGYFSASVQKSAGMPEKMRPAAHAVMNHLHSFFIEFK